MSALGDYVHFHKKNYEKYGINPPRDKGPSADFSSTIAEVRNQLNNIAEINISVNKANELAKQYNDLFYKQTNDGKILEFRKQLEIALNEKLKERFQDLAGEVSMTDFSVKSGQNSILQFNDAFSTIKGQTKGAQKQGHITYAGKLLKKLQTIVDTLTQQMGVSKNSVQLQNELSNLHTQLSSVIADINSKITEQGSKRLMLGPNDTNILTIQALIKEYSKIDLNLQKGQVFEWALSSINANIQELADTELLESMRRVMGANVIGDASYDVKMKDFKDFKYNENIRFSLSDIKAGNKPIRSKIDVTITEGSGVQGAISAKNTTHPNWIAIVKDTTLYNILTLTHSYDFANHYLNVIVKTKSESNTSSASNLTEANRLIKGLALQSALVGYLDDKPDFLVVNDANNKKINVFSMKALLYLIQQDVINGKQDFPVEGINNNTSILQQWEDKDVGGADLRISKVLSKLSDFKVSAHLNASIFDSYAKLLSGGLTS